MILKILQKVSFSFALKIPCFLQQSLEIWLHCICDVIYGWINIFRIDVAFTLQSAREPAPTTTTTTTTTVKDQEGEITEEPQAAQVLSHQSYFMFSLRIHGCPHTFIHQGRHTIYLKNAKNTIFLEKGILLCQAAPGEGVRARAHPALPATSTHVHDCITFLYIKLNSQLVWGIINIFSKETTCLL